MPYSYERPKHRYSQQEYDARLDLLLSKLEAAEDRAFFAEDNFKGKLAESLAWRLVDSVKGEIAEFQRCSIRGDPERERPAAAKSGPSLGDRLRRSCFGFKVAQALKGDDYREDMARPAHEYMADPSTPRGWKKKWGDPQAHVSGPHSLARLVERRKREWGDPIGTPDDVERAIPRGDEAESGGDGVNFKEILEEAKYQVRNGLDGENKDSD